MAYASSSSFCLLLPFLMAFLILVANPVMSDEATQERISYICHQVEEFGYCNKTFNENLKNQTTDYVGLTRITIEQCIIKATNTHFFIVLLSKNVTDVGLKNALEVCENAYKVLQQSFQDALNYFNQKDYRSMMDSERITPRAQGSCSTSFEIPPFPTNPLVDRNRQMRILLTMAMVTGHQLDV